MARYVKFFGLGGGVDGFITGSCNDIQTTSYLQANGPEANINVAIIPKGTGAIVAACPDGTATGGNARGAYSVDLQRARLNPTDVAASPYSVIVGGQDNELNGGATHSTIVGGYNNRMINSDADYGFIGGGQSNAITSANSTISGGQNNIASTNTHATVVGGSTNTSSGQYSVSGGYSNVASGESSVALGRNNIASSKRAVALGASNTASGESSVALCAGNTASATYSSVVGGNNNTASGQRAIVISGIYNTSSGTSGISGGYSNLASGDNSVALGYDNEATVESAIAIGFENKANAISSIALNSNSKSYLESQLASASGRFSTTGDAQQSLLTARKQDTLASSATTVLSLDGTGTTNLIIPDGNNRAWNVTVKWVAVCTNPGSGTTALGDVSIATDSFMFKRVGGTSSIGVLTNLQNSQDPTMAGATCSYAVGGSQDLQISFTAPSSANATTFRVVAKVELTEVAW